MKQKILQILLMAATLAWSGEAGAWGESTSYVLNATSEVNKVPVSTSGTTFDSYAVFSGPGKTLTFKIHRSRLGVWAGMQVQCLTNGSWVNHDLSISTPGTSYGSDISFAIPEGTTRIRLHLKVGCTLRYYIKDVKVTRATTLATPTETLDFGAVAKGSSSTLNAYADYNNTTYNQQITGSCTDGAFSVTAATAGATSYTGTWDGILGGTSYKSTAPATVPVTFSPTASTAVGTHTGTVTLNMNGQSVTFNVTGVCQTTYYTRAIASATTGGRAYVSYTSYADATTSDVTTNSGLTAATSATATAYFKAVADEGYEFVEWRWTDSGETASTNAEEKWENYEYNTESAAAPFTAKFTAVFKKVAITLDPTDPNNYDPDTYRTVTLSRTLRAGYNTIALPFATDVATLTGRTSSDDWVAELYAVTYNAQDGYTLFFQKVSDGSMAANKPYVLYLGTAVVNPSWSDLTVGTATSTTVTAQTGYSGYGTWSMTSNFAAAKDMSGLYGIVNAESGIKRGGTGSTLNAFTAYITGVGVDASATLRSAYVDDDGTVTYVGSLPTAPQEAPSAVFRIDGIRTTALHPGLNIVRMSDGRVRKILR